jgi:hypothetical protein
VTPLFASVTDEDACSLSGTLAGRDGLLFVHAAIRTRANVPHT